MARDHTEPDRLCLTAVQRKWLDTICDLCRLTVVCDAYPGTCPLHDVGSAALEGQETAVGPLSDALDLAAEVLRGEA
jgi:hypothetical protein